MNIYVDSKMTDNARRECLNQGSIFVYSPSVSSLKFCQFAQGLIEAAFAPLDPLWVQESLPVERCAEILGTLKPTFIHHPESKRYIQSLLADFGCDPAKTYFDVPCMRTAFPGDHLKSGIAYAFHPHRETWYSAPFSQINWWFPIYDICADNAMAFHPLYWDTPVPNNSNIYNYYEWNRNNRRSAAGHVKTDTRPQPRPLADIELDPQIRVIAKVGGPMLFSAAHLHSTVPNTAGLTRFSIDFRTVHLDDVWRKCGARNVDTACTVTTMRDYISAADLTLLPEPAVAVYYDGTEAGFVPSPTGAGVGVGEL